MPASEPIYGQSLLKAKGLTVGYESGSTQTRLLAGLNFDLLAGELVCLIGPNGCGKSTLIKTITGLQPSLQGNILCFGKDLNLINNKERSKLLGVVLTDPIHEQNLKVVELVSMGRYHYSNWMGQMSHEDKALVLSSIRNVGLSHKINAPLAELSDGEKQRALLAKVLAQDVDLIVLDEPTAHLDLPNRVEVLTLLRRFAKESNKAILISSHELELALQVSDRMWIVDQMGQMIKGAPEDIICSGVLGQVFGNDQVHFNQNTASFVVVQDSKYEIQLEQKGELSAYAHRMLSRIGFKVINTPSFSSRKLQALDDKLVYSDGSGQKEFEDFLSLQRFLLQVKRTNDE